MKRLLIAAGILISIGASIFALKTLSDATRFAAFSKIEDSKPALTVAEVEKLMGSPSQIEHSETTGIIGDIYHYPTPSGADMKVVFINGVVFHAEFVPGAKS